MVDLKKAYYSLYDKIMAEQLKQESALKIPFENITPNDEFYLDILYRHKGITLSEFASLAKVTKPGATHIITRFEKLGAVYRTQSSTDKRVYHLELNSALITYYQKSYQIFDDIFRKMELCLKPDEVSFLIDLFKKMEGVL
ncbi:hypothetical protein JCM15457_1058 [Liquorilactobacillus sucicola DSM 21376 = JCM 15457]|uniref:HTH marR-type domain-containing protein n=1 Tax=Liquorilactobacillus sucicola DSM 21376 = JCM 15457 TaxID=1423806 RepID=A0A023CX42_9LACO|nr:MarR family transcriptional regulator [Liquorilactobacillus sucicola]KRN06214.1 hypothetical protein FD15_GL001410 [Liquorilactobacillus sucicola DSM 21376 = JCM 15457]GAJ26146.1 hypothetical protein JCM15457_1058 [Liquorilactobacillus sucicola DSM 21376 = JCM 15457]